MAGYADQLTIKVSAEDAGVKASVTAMRAEIRGLEKELAKSNAEWMKTGKGSDEIKRAEARIVGLRTEVGKLTGAQRKATSQTKAHGNAFAKMGQQVNRALGGLNNPLLFAGGGIALAMFAKKTMTAASDVVESVNKTKVIFGEGAQAVIDFADTAADAFGQSKSQALSAASNFAALGKAAGMTGTELSGFAVDLTGLASDMASFSNTTPEEAIVALSAAMRGEYEPIRRFNVLLDAATLSQAAYSQGLTDTVQKVLPQSIKVQAAYNAVMAQTKDQQGDFMRTQDEYANLTRRVSAEWANLQASIGESFLPVAKQALMVLKGLFGALSGVDGGLRGTIVVVAALGAGLVLLLPRLQSIHQAFLALKAAAAAAAAASGAQGFAGAMSAIVGMVNPYVAALAVIAATVLGVTKVTADAEAGAEQYVATLNDVTGAVTDASTAMAIAQLQSNIAPDDWKLMEQYGITLRDVADAAVAGGPALVDMLTLLYKNQGNTGFWSKEWKALQGAQSALIYTNADVTKSQQIWEENKKEIDANKTALEAYGAKAYSAADAQTALDDALQASIDSMKELDGLISEQDKRDAFYAALYKRQERLRKKWAGRMAPIQLNSPAARQLRADFKPGLSTGRDLANTYLEQGKPGKGFGIAKKLMDDTVAASKDIPMTEAQRKDFMAPYVDLVNKMRVARDDAERIKAVMASSKWQSQLPTVPNITNTGTNQPGDYPTYNRADGGPVWGPGTGTSDSIPAMLSNGEFVVRAAAVRALGIDTLTSINRADKMVDPSLYTRLSSRDAARAPVAQPVAAQRQSGPAIGTINVTATQTVDVERAVLTALRRAERIKRERG